MLGYGSLAVGAPGLLLAGPATEKRPNIVLIMVDDMGYSDIGCYGGEIRTPNLDRLAENGLRFTQFYNTARCCPTRASLLTGLYAHQTGIGHMTNPPERPRQHDKGLPAYRGCINSNCVTIAEALKPAGYHVLLSGKWHVSGHIKEHWPMQRGFERFYGLIPGASHYFKPAPPRGMTLGNEHIDPEGEAFYTTDAFTDYGIRFIKEARAQDDRPFFLYLAFTAPHWPLHAPKEDIDRYRSAYMKGWDALRRERYERMQAMGILKDGWALPERDARAWDELGEAKKKEMDLRMAIYAAQVDRMDQNVGRLVNALREMGELDNTLILFLSDNGGCAEGGELGGGKAEDLEGDRGGMVSYGRAWANVSNTPFKRYKHWVHEGGIATPLICHWPARIKDKGAMRWQPGHVIDLLPTCLDIAGAKYPTEFAGNRIPPVEGKSLLPAFDDRAIDREAIFWEHEGNRAVRMGKWKLVGAHGDKLGLYDMDADRTEMRDLSSEHPELRKRMISLYDQWAARCSVAPWPLK